MPTDYNLHLTTPEVRVIYSLVNDEVLSINRKISNDDFRLTEGGQKKVAALQKILEKISLLSIQG